MHEQIDAWTTYPSLANPNNPAAPELIRGWAKMATRARARGRHGNNPMDVRDSPASKPLCFVYIYFIHVPVFARKLLLSAGRGGRFTSFRGSRSTTLPPLGRTDTGSFLLLLSETFPGHGTGAGSVVDQVSTSFIYFFPFKKMGRQASSFFRQIF